MNNEQMHQFETEQLGKAMELVRSMTQALKEEQLLRQAAEEQLAAQRNKVLFADAVSGSRNSILVGEMAVILKQAGVETGQERLFEWLRRHGYVYRQKCGQNLPTQRSLELGVMELKKQAVVGASGSISVNSTPKITPKGQLYFLELLTSQKDTINAAWAADKARRRQEAARRRAEAKTADGAEITAQAEAPYGDTPRDNVIVLAERQNRV